MGIGHGEGAVDDSPVLAIGMGGYIGGRSLEKVAGTLRGEDKREDSGRTRLKNAR